MNLSEHFTLTEGTKTQVRGVDNNPPADVIERMKLTAKHILEPVRAHFGKGVFVNSFYRSERVEKAVCWHGDNKDSPFAKWCLKRDKPVNEQSWAVYFATKQHPGGEAVDFEIPGIDNAEVAKWVRDNLMYDQIILEFYEPGEPSSGWVHCSYKTDFCRAQSLTINKHGTKTGLG